MFNDAFIVQSAVSAFNNAALNAPAFLWWAILAVPVYFMAYFCGGAFMSRIGWNRNNIMSRMSIAAVVFMIAWIVLFGGNYGVLRDSASVLPFMTAAILFLGMLFIGSHTRNIALPNWRTPLRIGGIALVLVTVGLSDMHAWWGPILQIVAFVGGFVIGRSASRHEMPEVAGTLLIIMMITTAILMQPEFFRFGQLGDLTPIHLLFILLIGAFAAAAIALRNINPCGKIHRSAYIKLKWMARFLVVLGAALFFLTESVPIFLGTSALLLTMFAMSVWHAEKIPVALDEKMFAITVGLFGVITVMPALSVMGILYWTMLPHGNMWRESWFLL